jgi:hypothetical protein
LIRDDYFAISGAADGSTKLWALEDGQVLDTYMDASASKTTALALLGPVMVRCKGLLSVVWGAAATLAEQICKAMMASA